MKVLKGKSNGLGAIAVVFLMVGVAFVGLIGGGGYTSASSMIFSASTRDGFISGEDGSFPPALDTVDDVDTDLFVGSSYDSGIYWISRAFISFDTSTLPDSASVTSATLRVRTSTASFTDGDVQLNVYTSGFGTLDVGDYEDYDTFQGVIVNTYVAYAWYSLTIASGSIDLDGYTGFCIAYSQEIADVAPTDERMAVLSSSESSYDPVLEIQYNDLSGTDICIELDSGSWVNGTAFPDTQDWNLTYELHCYELDTLPSSKNMTITKQDANWTFAGLSPSCNYTDSDASLVLEDVYDSICYRVWFYVPKSNPYTSVHLSLYNSFTGEGFFWEQMKVMICDGLTWDNTTAEGVARPTSMLSRIRTTRLGFWITSITC